MKGTDNFIYKFYKKNDENQIISLFKKTFKRELSLNNWTWTFKKNPTGKNRILLVFYKYKLVGQCASIKLSFKLNKQKKNFFRIQNFMVDINFRGRSIAYKALKFLTSNIVKSKNYIISFPNNNSLKAFLKIGYTKFNLHSYEMIIRKKYQIEKNIFIKNSKQINFSKEDIKLINEFLNKFSIFNLRTKNYLNWRYNRNYNSYKISRVYLNKKLKGLAIIKFYSKDSSICICELFYKKNFRNFSSVLEAIILNLKKNKPKRLKIWSMPHFSFHKNLLKSGFKKTNFKTNVCTYKNFPTGNIKKKFYLSMGDSDVY